MKCFNISSGGVPGGKEALRLALFDEGQLLVVAQVHVVVDGVRVGVGGGHGHSCPVGVRLQAQGTGSIPPPVGGHTG